MRCSLFGKLAAKRDFIALFAPRDFLNAWEPWMQGCVSASRDSLGESWQQAYLTAPIWRFWLGPDICGATVVGAFMSSLDGVGRYYPLTLFAYADPGNAIASPDIDAHDEWLGAGEDLLLSTLDKDVTFEAITTALEQLAAPAQQPTDLPPEGMSILKGGSIASPLGGGSFSDLFASLRDANHSSIYAAASFWWTVGGDEYRPLALCCRRMPDPSLFTNMLTGRLNSATASNHPGIRNG
jgi:type VI secretion system protein ImpM